MPSLLEALERKYGLGSCDMEHQESQVSIFVPKLPPRLMYVISDLLKYIIIINLHFYSVPELLVLNDCDIDKAGEPEDLKQKCCSVKELDLAQNKLQNWCEVFTILSHMPRVEFVNLSLNRLCGPVEPPNVLGKTGMGHIKNLVLNNTRLDWDSVETVIKLLPALEELHLSLNEYRNVLIDTIDDFSDILMDVDGEEDLDVPDDLCTCHTEKMADNKSTKRSKTFFLLKIILSN